MSRSMNPEVVAFVPAKPLFGPAMHHRCSPNAPKITPAGSSGKDRETLGNIPLNRPPTVLSTASLRKGSNPNAATRRKRRKGKGPASSSIKPTQEPIRSSNPALHSVGSQIQASRILSSKLERSYGRKEPTDWERIVNGARDIDCHQSPFLPKNEDDYNLHKQMWGRSFLQTIGRKHSDVEVLEGENRVNNCMGGKSFATNHSAILSFKTIWRPQGWKDLQKETRWPLPCEFYIEGPDRRRGGFRAFFPVPRSDEFEWRLATDKWRANPKGTKHPVWDGRGEIPAQERRFATVRGDLDRILGFGRPLNEHFLVDRVEEIAWEDGAKFVGRSLWGEVGGQPRSGGEGNIVFNLEHIVNEAYRMAADVA